MNVQNNSAAGGIDYEAYGLRVVRSALKEYRRDNGFKEKSYTNIVRDMIDHGCIVTNEDKKADIQVANWSRRLSRFERNFRGPNSKPDNQFLRALIDFLTHEDINVLHASLLYNADVPFTLAKYFRDTLQTKSVSAKIDEDITANPSYWSGESEWLGFASHAYFEITPTVFDAIMSINLFFSYKHIPEKSRKPSTIKVAHSGFLIFTSDDNGRGFLFNAESNDVCEITFACNLADETEAFAVSLIVGHAQMPPLDEQTKQVCKRFLKSKKNSKLFGRIPAVSQTVQASFQKAILTKSVDEWYIGEVFFDDINSYCFNTQTERGLGLLGGLRVQLNTIDLIKNREEVFLQQLREHRQQNVDEFLENYISAGGNINIVDFKNGYTPLIYAASSGSRILFRALMKYEHLIDFTVKDQRGRTASFVADIQGLDLPMGELIRRKAQVQRFHYQARALDFNLD